MARAYRRACSAGSVRTRAPRPEEQHLADVSPLRDRPAWSALQAHHDELSAAHLRDLFAADPGRGGALQRRRGRPASRLLEEPDRRRDAAAAARAGCAVRAARAHRRDVPRRPDQRLRGPLGAPRRAADAARRHAGRRRRGRRRPGPRGARPDGGVRRRRALGRVDRPHRQADPQRRQRRDRRLRPRPGDGVRGAALLLGPRPDAALRLERRLDGHRRGDPRPRSRGDAVHHRLEDVHDARDDDQRDDRRASGRWPRSGTRRPWPSTSSPSPRTPSAWRRSASTPPTCSGSGTGSAAATRWTRRSASRR